MIDELIAQAAGAPFNTMEYAFTAAPVKEISQEAPAGFIYVLAESAPETATDNRVRQKVTTEFIVHIVCRYQDLEACKAALRSRLLGFQITPHHDPVQFVTAGIDQRNGIQGEYYWWAERYKTGYLIKQI